MAPPFPESDELNVADGGSTGNTLSNDFNPREAVQFFQQQRALPGEVQMGDQLVVGDAYQYHGRTENFGMLPSANSPEGAEFMKALSGPGALEFSTQVDNAANGQQPDYRLVEQDGQMKLIKVGDGDPMADGKLNIEVEAENKSLIEAIQNADKNMKEFAREMISYWRLNHPNEPIPQWWQSLLDSQPLLPPEQQAPVPVRPREEAPPQREAPQPSQPAPRNWEGDYRGGGGSGYGGGGNGRSGYAGGGDNRGGYYGGRDSGGRTWHLPNEVPDYGDSPFIRKLMDTVMKNEGALTADGKPNFMAYNPDDNGGISVGLRQWHAGGALPELLNAWKDADPQKFENYFKGYTPAQINSMSSSQFASTPGLEQGMKAALADPEYQKVQTNLMENWVKREVKLAMDGGLTTEKEIATFVDIANQYGQDKANSTLPVASRAGDQSEQIHNAVRGGQYGERFATIDRNFSTQVASLEPRVPIPSAFGERLAQAVERVDSRMAGTGNCAAAVQYALQAVGEGRFMGSGNAWQMLNPLLRSGKFVQVSQDQATRGDLIVREPSGRDGSIHGDISVVTARNGNYIEQTNDASYQFHTNNPRYDRTVFLRYVGDRDRDTQVASNRTSETDAGDTKPKPRRA